MLIQRKRAASGEIMNWFMLRCTESIKSTLEPETKRGETIWNSFIKVAEDSACLHFADKGIFEIHEKKVNEIKRECLIHGSWGHITEICKFIKRLKKQWDNCKNNKSQLKYSSFKAQKICKNNFFLKLFRTKEKSHTFVE